MKKKADSIKSNTAIKPTLKFELKSNIPIENYGFISGVFLAWHWGICPDIDISSAMIFGGIFGLIVGIFLKPYLNLFISKSNDKFMFEEMGEFRHWSYILVNYAFGIILNGFIVIFLYFFIESVKNKISLLNTENIAVSVHITLIFWIGYIWNRNVSTRWLMARIPAADFIMGSSDDEQGRSSDEGPVRQVSLSNDFCISKYQITQVQWEAVMGERRSAFSSSKMPTANVSWIDCLFFCNRLSELMDLTPVYDLNTRTANWNANGFRLPTEAEWEYACRGGTQTRFYWGDDVNYSKIGDYAWYSNNSDSQNHSVGLKRPNKLGLYDMNGNVCEWCWDWYQSSYASLASENPTGTESGSYRVIRGGDCKSNAMFCRSATRGKCAPESKETNIGFRVVCSPSD